MSRKKEAPLMLQSLLDTAFAFDGINRAGVRCAEMDRSFESAGWNDDLEARGRSVVPR